MKALNSHEIIVKPMVTEKAAAGEQEHTYTFMVHPRATKIEIRKAVEEIYKVHVRKVRTATMHGKEKRFRSREYRQPEHKKAMVTVSSNERIEII